ncbi:hypothetical protein BDV12DRAFT_201151 [Aspergillus spectabilis]
MSEKQSDRPSAGVKIRFRRAPRPKQSFDFAPDQKWVGSRHKRRLTHIDMTPRVAGDSAQNDSSNPSSRATGAPNSNGQPSSQNEYGTPPSEFAERDPGIAACCRYPVEPLHGYPGTYFDSSYMDFQESCLTRRFIENLAPLFDTSDMDQQFTIVVPERAVLCPVLRYAVYIASAGHLLRLAVYRNESHGIVSLDGMRLPKLTPDTAIRYHDICIAHLIEISKDPKEEYNEDALTAATILRFYEQADSPSIGNSEAYLNAIQFIVNTQKTERFYAYQTIDGPPRDSSVHHTSSTSPFGVSRCSPTSGFGWI